MAQCVVRVDCVHGVIASHRIFSLRDLSILFDFLAVVWVTNPETSILLIFLQIAVSF